MIEAAIASRQKTALQPYATLRVEQRAMPQFSEVLYYHRPVRYTVADHNTWMPSLLDPDRTNHGRGNLPTKCNTTAPTQLLAHTTGVAAT